MAPKERVLGLELELGLEQGKALAQGWALEWAMG